MQTKTPARPCRLTCIQCAINSRKNRAAHGPRRRPNPPRRSSADLLADTSPSRGFASLVIAGRADRHRPRLRSPAAVAAAGIQQLSRYWPGHVDRRAPGARSAVGKSRAGYGHFAVATGGGQTHPPALPSRKGASRPLTPTAMGEEQPHNRWGSLDHQPPGKGTAALQSSPVRCSPASRLRAACGFRADP
ncbi:hypothetical protein QFZ38_005550 [Pseudomonas cedrina]|nr:hypothetical protein [Pseudomonas cedrina]